LGWSKPTPRTVVFAAVTVTAVLAAAAGGFWLGRNTPIASPSEPVPTATSTPTPVSSLNPGTYDWDELIAGTCIAQFESAWELTYDVVPCSTAHEATVTRAGQVPGFAEASSPGEAMVAQAVLPLCTEIGLVDAATAQANPALQYTFAYPVNASQWRETQGRFVCFVSG
jgi:hypothetical protein